MGAIGKSDNRAKTVEQKPNATKKAQKIVNYFSERTFGKLDIAPYLEPTYDKQGYITIDYKRMPKLVQQRYNQVVQEGRIESTDYGAWGKWIKLKK